MGRRTPPFVSIHQATKEKKEPDKNSQRSTLQFCVLLDGAKRFEPLKKKKKRCTIENHNSGTSKTKPWTTGGGCGEHEAVYQALFNFSNTI
jgi:hypothetical protein